jgi:hypothetical protein
MERLRLRKPALSQNEDACPRDPAFLAPTANGTPPERKHPIPKHPQHKCPRISYVDTYFTHFYKAADVNTAMTGRLLTK